ncbi:MAG: hypothetical protein HRF49_09020 [bacterium]
MALEVYSPAVLPAARPRVAIAIGTFDGVHRGHWHILDGLAKLAESVGAAPMVAMFDYPPAIFFNPHLPRELIALPRERVSLLEARGVQILLELNFDAATSKMKAREFLDKVNVNFDIQGLLVGYDHRIGSDRIYKDVDYIRICDEVGIGFSRIGRKLIGRHTVSSSLVRRMIRDARMRAAAALLGRYHRVSGVVIPGERIGRAALACPTANVLLPDEKLGPPAGVYAGIARIENGEEWPRPFNAAINIMPARVKAVYGGELPDRQLIEAHLLDFDGDLYGKTIHMDFVRRLRPERRFPDLASLKVQIAEDVADVAKLDPLSLPVPDEEEALGLLEEDARE